ncbi:hypothetical protein [Staphylococcus succinus]|uniref:hypothetical protein n=1 Tax=Staphylococcus succinus TaxID=61015 RepID=UPI00301BBF17
MANKFDELLEQFSSEETELTVTKPLTDLQLTKDNSIQAVPLSNEAYEKELKGEK